jgi:mono/diheme cytochrome c family protein
MKVRIAFVLMTVGAVTSAVVSLSALQTRSQWDGVYTADQAKRGEPLFAEKCASCHGSDLKGTERAPALVGTDFCTNWDDLSVGDLFEKIRISMPQGAPNSLSRGQYADVLAFILQKDDFPAGSADLPSDMTQLNAYKFLAKKP